MQIQMKSIDQIRPNPRNARTHSKQQIHQIAASIQTFGFRNPILIDETGMIIAGHGRLAAAAQLAMKEVPTIEAAGLSPAQQAALALADNRIAENAGWNEEILTIELKKIAELEVDFDLEITGFETAEIDLLIDGHDKSKQVIPIDHLPSPTETSVTRVGNLWVLGDHRLLCADSRDQKVFDTLMSGDQARMAMIDPPYNVRIDGHAGGSGAIKHREFPMAVGELSQAQYIEFLSGAFNNVTAVSRDGAIHFVFIDWRHIGEVLAAGSAAYSELKNLCVWNKHVGGMGSFYRSKHELVFVFKYGTAPHVNTIELGRHGRYRTNVWDYPGVDIVDLRMHPTVKPTALVIDAIKDCSRRGDIALDPFAGSGTCIVAAEKCGRRARAIELDPLYVDVAVRRWETLTGKTAHLLDNGRSFAEMAANKGQSSKGSKGHASSGVAS